MSPDGDAVFSTWVTFVSIRSTYTQNMSKNTGQIDMSEIPVDQIDTYHECVDIS
jgi:hypothetical protein